MKTLIAMFFAFMVWLVMPFFTVAAIWMCTLATVEYMNMIETYTFWIVASIWWCTIGPMVSNVVFMEIIENN